MNNSNIFECATAYNIYRTQKLLCSWSDGTRFWQTFQVYILCSNWNHTLL